LHGNATEKKKQEQSIITNERRFKGLVQAGSDLISIVSLQGEYQYVSPTVTNVLGYDPEFLVNRSVFDLINPQHHDIVRSALTTVSQQFRVELPLFQIKSAKGEWRWLKTIATNMVNEECIGGIVANSRDVTEQIRTEEQKERAIRRLNNLIENYTQGYLSLDRDWMIKGINPATLRLLGMSEDMLINKSIRELFPRLKGKSYNKQYARVIQEGRLIEFEERMADSNRWFHISAYPYEGELTVFFKEVTDEKLQQLLVNLEKEVLEQYIGATANLKATVDLYLKGLTDIYGIVGFLSLYKKRNDMLYPFSAPTFPLAAIEAIAAGFPVSTDAGSCGAAAFEREAFIVRDIASHPNFEKSRDILLQHNLRSGWSLPLVNAKNKLVGTLGVYHNEIKVPDTKEIEFVKRVASFLQVLIESQAVKEKLILSNERYKYITHATNDATYDWNLMNDYLYWGEGQGKLFGYTNNRSKIDEWERRIHVQERARVSKSLEDAMNNPDVTYWKEEYRYRRADKSYAFVIDDGYIIRDDNGKPVRMVGALKDITKLRESANQILKQNERLQEIATINSHHIRKPLANVLGIINALRFAKDDQEELLAMLESSGQELDAIVRSIAEKTLI
jgi:PAS domain S-box-containing protein